MGRKGSDLVPFLRKALKKNIPKNIYPNLKLVSKNPLIFSLRLPRKTSKLDESDEQILKDWRRFKKQPYTYSTAKQAVETALKTSNFFQLIAHNGDEFVYQFLEDADILRKKRAKKEQMKKDKEYTNILSIQSSGESSGYGSGEDIGESSPKGKREDKLEEVPATVSSDSDEMGTESPEDEFEEVIVTLPSLNMENDEMLTESPEEDVMEEGEQGIIDPNLLLGDQSHGYYYPILETESFDQLDLTSVNPNDILDARINLYPHFKEQEDGEDKSINVKNDADSIFENFSLQRAFEDIDTSGYDATSVEELMDIPNSELDPQVSENSKPSLFYLKKILPSADGTFLVFSRKVVHETNDGRNDSGGPSSICMDKEQLQKITDARCPITVGISNGEPFVYVKHYNFA